MVDQERNKAKQSTKRARLKYFFLNDELHVKLHINRGKDLLTAWNYPQGKRVLYDYSTALRRMKRAWTTKEVCQLMNRHINSVENAIRNGNIAEPQYTYGLNEHRRKFQYMWREEDVMDLHEYFASLHIGRPRRDGERANNTIPTPRELRALMNNEYTLYVKQGNTFVPSWKAREY